MGPKNAYAMRFTRVATILVLCIAGVAAGTCSDRGAELSGAHAAHFETASLSWAGYDGGCAAIPKCNGPNAKVQESSIECLGGETQCCIITESAAGAVACSNICEPGEPGGSVYPSQESGAACSTAGTMLVVTVAAGVILFAAAL